MVACVRDSACGCGLAVGAQPHFEHVIECHVLAATNVVATAAVHELPDMILLIVNDWNLSALVEFAKLAANVEICDHEHLHQPHARCEFGGAVRISTICFELSTQPSYRRNTVCAKPIFE